MKKTVHYIGLDVHKETMTVAIAPENTSEVRPYGIIGELARFFRAGELTAIYVPGQEDEAMRNLMRKCGRR